VLAALTVPFALMVGSWLGWKWSYYGRLLPNSYYAKVGLRPVMISNGLLYVWRFLHWYGLWPVFAAGLLALWLRRPARAARLRPIVWFVLAWLTYVALVGGDFMEFRFLVPVTACFFLLLAWLAGEVIGRRLLRRPVLASLVVLASSAGASVIHARTFHDITPDRTLDSIGVLKTGYGMCPDGNWGRVGNLLRASLASADPMIAVDAAGAIPYFSRFRSVDMLGINDRWVAAHGDPAPRSYRRPGHQRRAPMGYLRARGVQIVIAHPTIVLLRGFEYPQAGPFLARWVQASSFATRPDSIDQFTFALMPVSPDYGLLLWLLAPTPAIDSIIVANHWPTQTFLARPLNAPDTTGARPEPRSTPQARSRAPPGDASIRTFAGCSGQRAARPGRGAAGPVRPSPWQIFPSSSLASRAPIPSGWRAPRPPTRESR
jgi:hypothetical protein